MSVAGTLVADRCSPASQAGRPGSLRLLAHELGSQLPELEFLAHQKDPRLLIRESWVRIPPGPLDPQWILFDRHRSDTRSSAREASGITRTFSESGDLATGNSAYAGNELAGLLSLGPGAGLNPH